MVAACGLICNECDIYRATSDTRAAEELAARFREEQSLAVAAEEIRCEGCKGDRQRHWSPDCDILECCVDEKGLEFCYLCPDFPCPRLHEWSLNSPRYASALERLKKMKFDRQEAWALVSEFTQNQNLVRHMLAVEAAMRAYARKYDEDEELYGIVGLIHDFDYEQNPDLTVEGHPVTGSKILRDRGWPEEVIHAVLSHASEYTGVSPETRLENVLAAVDELTGLLVAVALVRPSKDLRDVRLKSVRKKWKDRAFAAAVDRELIEQAGEALGVDLDEHIQTVLDAMKEIAPELGLSGEEE